MLRPGPFLLLLWSSLRSLFSTFNSLFTVLCRRIRFPQREEDIERSGGLVEAAIEKQDAVTQYRYIAKTTEAPQPRPREVIYVSKGKLLAWGGTAVLERLPSGAVMKTPIPDPYNPVENEDRRRYMRLEANIYRVIGEHARIPRLIHWEEETCCLSMEYLDNGNLKGYVLQNDENISLELRLRWSRQAAEALTVLHRQEVIHCDLSPRNFLLDADLNVKIADFGGASLKGSDPSATPTTRFRRPGYDLNGSPKFEDDIFGLGSLIYFIMTASEPYGEIASNEVEKRYESSEFPTISSKVEKHCKSSEFPAIASLVYGTVILQCWHQQVNSVQLIHDLLVAIERQHSI